MPPFVDSAEYVSGAREGPRKQLQTAYYRQTPPETPRRGVSYISDLLDNFGSGGRDRFVYIYCLNTGLRVGFLYFCVPNMYLFCVPIFDVVA